jgi:hypothetical protein
LIKQLHPLPGVFCDGTMAGGFAKGGSAVRQRTCPVLGNAEQYVRLTDIFEAPFSQPYLQRRYGFLPAFTLGENLGSTDISPSYL